MADCLAHAIDRNAAFLIAFQNLRDDGRSARHDDIVACLNGIRAVNDDIHVAPVGHDHAVISPLAAENVRIECAMAAGKGAVDLVEGGHDDLGPGGGDHHLEGFQIDLSRRAGTDDRVRSVDIFLGAAAAVGLLLVQRKVLRTAGKSVVVFLCSANDSDAAHAGKIGILGKILERASLDGIADDVHAGSEPGIDVKGDCLLSAGCAELIQQVHVEGAAEHHSRGPAGFADAGRSVLIISRVNTVFCQSGILISGVGSRMGIGSDRSSILVVDRRGSAFSRNAAEGKARPVSVAQNGQLFQAHLRDKIFHGDPAVRHVLKLPGFTAIVSGGCLCERMLRIGRPVDLKVLFCDLQAIRRLQIFHAVDLIRNERVDHSFVRFIIADPCLYSADTDLLLYINHHSGHSISGRITDQDLIAAGCYDICTLLLVKIRQLLHRNQEFDHLGLARRQKFGFGKCFELLMDLRHDIVRAAQICLHDFLAGVLPGEILDRHLDDDLPVLHGGVLTELLKGSVGETVAEGIQDFFVEAVKISVSYIDVLFIKRHRAHGKADAAVCFRGEPVGLIGRDLLRHILIREHSGCCREILIAQSKGLGELSGRSDCPA